jgi:hypothetical protein
MSRPFQHRIKKQVEPSSDYGVRIGAPPGTMFTMDFKDSDRDGVDDRHQPGPGMADPRWKGRKPAPPRREGPKFEDRNDPRRDRMEKALQDRRKRDLLTGRARRFHDVLRRGRPPEREMGKGFPGGPPIGRPTRPPEREIMKGKGFPGGPPIGRPTRPPRKGTVKGSRPRPDMPSPKPPMGGGTIGGTIGTIGAIGGGRPPRRGGGSRPPMFGGGTPKPPRGGKTVKGSRPRPPMPSPKPPRGGGRPHGREPFTPGGIR